MLRSTNLYLLSKFDVGYVCSVNDRERRYTQLVCSLDQFEGMDRWLVVYFFIERFRVCMTPGMHLYVYKYVFPLLSCVCVIFCRMYDSTSSAVDVLVLAGGVCRRKKVSVFSFHLFCTPVYVFGCSVDELGAPTGVTHEEVRRRCYFFRNNFLIFFFFADKKLKTYLSYHMICTAVVCVKGEYEGLACPTGKIIPQYFEVISSSSKYRQLRPGLWFSLDEIFCRFVSESRESRGPLAFLLLCGTEMF